MRKTGEVVFSKVEKVNSELFSLTYGAIVTQLLKDYEEVDATNEQLEKMSVLPPASHNQPPLPCPSGVVMRLSPSPRLDAGGTTLASVSSTSSSPRRRSHRATTSQRPGRSLPR